MLGAVRSRKRGEFAHEGGQAAGMVEVLHVVRAGGLEVEQDGDFAAELVEGVEVEGDTGAAGDCDEVDEAVGRPADGLQDDHRVADGGWGDEVAGLGRAGDGDFGGAFAAGFRDAAAVGEWSGRGGAEWGARGRGLRRCRPSCWPCP